MTLYDALTGYYRRVMGCTAEDADARATHIVGTLERRQGQGGCDRIDANSTKPPRRDERRTVSDGFLTRSKEPLHE